MLSGNLFENDSAVLATNTGPFTQTLTFTGETGEFAGATGSVSGGHRNYWIHGIGEWNPDWESATLIGRCSTRVMQPIVSSRASPFIVLHSGSR
jgi:hypothetical protein